MNPVDKLIYQGWGLEAIRLVLPGLEQARTGESYFWDALRESGDVGRAVEEARAEMRRVLGSFDASRARGLK